MLIKQKTAVVSWMNLENEPVTLNIRFPAYLRREDHQQGKREATWPSS